MTWYFHSDHFKSSEHDSELQGRWFRYYTTRPITSLSALLKVRLRVCVGQYCSLIYLKACVHAKYSYYCNYRYNYEGGHLANISMTKVNYTWQVDISPSNSVTHTHTHTHTHQRMILFLCWTYLGMILDFFHLFISRVGTAVEAFGTSLSIK